MDTKLQLAFYAGLAAGFHTSEPQELDKVAAEGLRPMQKIARLLEIDEAPEETEEPQDASDIADSDIVARILSRKA